MCCTCCCCCFPWTSPVSSCSDQPQHLSANLYPQLHLGQATAPLLLVQDLHHDSSGCNRIYQGVKTFPTYASPAPHYIPQKLHATDFQTTPGPSSTSSNATRRASCCWPSQNSYSPTYSWTSGSLSSNYSLTFWNFVKLLPLLLLKRLHTWICYFNWTAYRGCPEVLTGI